ncbi:hypothetical protein JDV02_005102 [Purpureocillium takamizusanense]|uniref:Uncharacterized protein n=1 Tax=Purpureocillium takamizusanense TaxID=2060973 RepID=A0A9Q8QHQ3_9HYPO|nr:uncharacterized protein JDV02_005102 [Purpureocillium takamizusanense]UNI18862.1 hypothetical protein JDV02_005102 [Purpureocillium takamizusanense]
MKIRASTLAAAACLAGTALAWPMRHQQHQQQQGTQVAPPSTVHDLFEAEKTNALANQARDGPGVNNTTAPAGNSSTTTTTTTTTTTEDTPGGGAFKETTTTTTNGNGNGTTSQVQPYNATADPARAAAAPPPSGQQKGHDAKQQFADGLLGGARHLRRAESDEKGDVRKRDDGIEDEGDEAPMGDMSTMKDMSPETEAAAKPMAGSDGMTGMMAKGHGDMDKRMDSSSSPPPGMNGHGSEETSSDTVLERRLEHSDADNKMTGNHDIAHQMAAMSNAQSPAGGMKSTSPSSSPPSSEPQGKKEGIIMPTNVTKVDNNWSPSSPSTVAEAPPRVLLKAPTKQQPSLRPLSKREIGVLERFATYVRDLMDAGDETSAKPAASNSTGGGVMGRAVAAGGGGGGGGNLTNTTAAAEGTERDDRMDKVREAILERLAQGMDEERQQSGEGPEKEEQEEKKKKKKKKDKMIERRQDVSMNGMDGGGDGGDDGGDDDS